MIESKKPEITKEQQQALLNFKKAGEDVLEIFYDNFEVLDEDYPFGTSFDEIICQIGNWIEKFKN